MTPTLYLADTCSLRDGEMRAYWEREFFTQGDERKLTIPCTVRCELERQKALPEHQAEAQAALDFLKKHAERVIHLPEQSGFVKGSVADREIFYLCALRQECDVVLYSADKKLTEAVQLMNPQVKVCCLQKKKVMPLGSLWRKVYTQLTERYCFYLTAACVNSASFAALMNQPDIVPLFRGKMFLSSASLPLLKERGKAVLEMLELQGLAPEQLVSGSIRATEKNDLLARLLTHSGKTPALVLLGEGDTLSDYTELSRIPLTALGHKGYTVAVLKGNGRISLQQPEPAEPEAPKAPAPAPKQAAPAPKVAAAQAQKGKSPAAEMDAKEQVRQWVLAGNIKKAGARMAENEELKMHALYTCFREDISKLPALLNSLTQRKQTLPAACFAAYVSNGLPTKAEELRKQLGDKSLVTALKRLIAGTGTLQRYKSTIRILQERMNVADESTRKVLQMLIDCAAEHGAPVPSAPEPPPAPQEAPSSEAADEVGSMTAAQKRAQLREWVIQGDVKKAGAMLEETHALIPLAVKVCLEGHMDKLLPLLNSLSQRKLKVPPMSLTYYVTQYLPQEKAALEAHLNDDDLQKVIRRMIKMSLLPPDGHAEAIRVMQQRKEQLEGKEAARIQNLIDMARTCAAAQV